MAIRRVLYKNESVEEIISLEEFPIREDYEEIKSSIFCAEENCDCLMQYVPRGANAAHFKKFPRREHHESCFYFEDIELGGRSRRNIGVNSTVLSTIYKRRVMREIQKTYLETSEEREERLERTRNLRRQRDQRVSGDNAQDEVTVNQPTTSNLGQRAGEGERNPTVRRRHSILDVLEANIGSTEFVIDVLVNVTNFENHSILTLTDKQNTKEFKLYLEEAFFENSPQNTPQMLLSLKKLVESQNEIIITAVGEIVFRDAELGMLVFSEEDLGFKRGVQLGSFLVLQNSLNHL